MTGPPRAGSSGDCGQPLLDEHRPEPRHVRVGQVRPK